jgi:RNA polymerase sigma-70 factor (ECF subfamily)
MDGASKVIASMSQPRPEPRAVPSELDDVTLARAARGDAAAWRQLVQHHEALVWSYIWRMLRPWATQAAVEDLFQDTFLGVHRGLPRFTPSGPARLSTWILAIATRVTLNHLRQRRHDRPPTDRGEVSDGGAGAAAMERPVLAAMLARALAALSADHRAIFVLREYHGLDYEEIARALDVEVGTVASRLNRARESLRRSLGENSP